MGHCTLWLEGWWSNCCAAHDASYAEQVERLVADTDLFMCVAASAPTPVLAAVSAVIGGIMWLGVRVFGARFYRKA